jgi:hypothetical protein
LPPSGAYKRPSNAESAVQFAKSLFILRLIGRHLFGKILRIALAETRSKLDNLRPRPYLLTDPEELVHLDWSEEWRP